MWVTEVLPSTADRVDAATAVGREWLERRYARDDRAYVRLNMITTLTGTAAGTDGTSESLTNRVDRTILGIIRAAADVVVVGAQSVRAEGYVVPRRARLAVVSRSGDLAGHRLTLDPDGPEDQVLVLVPASAPPVDAVPGMTVVRLPDTEQITPVRIVEALSSRGLTRIVCEGGPSIATQFADAGMIDEYCLTVAPVVTPSGTPIVAPATQPATEPVGMLVDGAGFSYLRLRVR
ncbi:dihydrofolate reductase family protein [Microbacterium dauci]|uniref:Dihydrofolate reductase family protein n=1 Tax=Microbacterium dauci TaxID=3048008 RepID=A0ABT6ZH14_9MICO|nr:dihydrofolate reductase family protein [Microbacterium sp. LX3-4]MDJ1115437.1 dihydrofolate reductase family protein [Microbacterium sp. LX3-4]